MGQQSTPMTPQDRVEQLLKHMVTVAGLDVRFTVETKKTNGEDVLSAVFSGPDTGLLLARDAELLFALEHLAGRALRLEPEQHHCVSFDAAGFKEHRERALLSSAHAAVEAVRLTGRAWRFAPMSSRERRMLHLALASSGLESRSEGEGAARCLVLHPAATS